MSAALMDAAVAHFRAAFSPIEVAEVLPYGGEFTAEEVPQLTYRCPAIMVTCLGWQPAKNPRRLAGQGVRVVSMAAFVAVKHASRAQRLSGAMALAERAVLALLLWQPESTAALEIAPVDSEARAENLYGRAMDKQGQALWLVTWQQEVRTRVSPAELWEMTAIDITDTTHPGVAPDPAPPPSSPPLVVTETVLFHPV